MKKYIKFLLFLILFMPFTTYAADMTYSQAQKAVKEAMQAWYMRGALRQYQNPRNTYGVLRHPEDITTQDYGYSVCSGFTGDVWMEAFGMKNNSTDNSIGGNVPTASDDYNDKAEKYLSSKKCKSSTSSPSTGCKAEYLLFFAKTDSSGKVTSSYHYKNNTSFNNFIQLVHPGDVFAYDGHVLIAYDLKKNSSGKVTDVLLLNSTTGKTEVFTKIDKEFSTHLMRYTKTYPEKNNILDLDQDNPVSYTKLEGTTRFLWLSKNEKFVKDGKFTCTLKNKRCSVTRAYYKDSDGNAAFNFKIYWPDQIQSSLLRINLPGIFIHKTSNKLDNASVYRGNEITYTVRITNYSNITHNGANKVTYPKFYLEESIPSNTTFVSKTYDEGIVGNYDDSTKKVRWTISSLKPGESRLFKFTVKVSTDYADIGKTLTQKGTVYINSNGSIGTGTVKHEIIRTNYTTDDEYSTCYEKTKKAGKTSLTLINETYKCLYGDSYGLDLTKYSASYLDKIIVDTSSGTSRRIALNTNGNYKKYTDIILDGYWNGMVKTSGGLWDLPKWVDSTAVDGYIGGSKRAKTIFSNHFKTGDVLIYSMTKDTKYKYTDEDGLYAFIYIGDQFVGVNYNGKVNQRNKYTFDYYSSSTRATKLYTGAANDSNYTYTNYQVLLGKDRYVILRPSKAIKQLASIKITTDPTKLKYIKGSSLNLTGGVLTLTNNDGTTSTVSMTNSAVKVTGYDKTKVGQQTLTVTYKKKTTTFKVTVVEKTVTKIVVKTNPTKTSYIVGQDLVLTGGVIRATYSDDSTNDISMTNTSVSASGYNKNNAGEQTITLTYSGKTTTFKVQVNNKTLTSLTIKSLPNKLSYNLGQDLNLTGGVLTKKYNDGSSTTIAMTNSSVSVSGFNKNSTGVQTITLGNEGKTVTFEVTVVAVDIGPGIAKDIDSISISNLPKTNYVIGDQLDLSSGTIKVKYIISSGANTYIEYEIVAMTDSHVSTSGFTSSNEGEKTVTVSYMNKSTTFNVQVSKKSSAIREIKMKKNPTKVKYVQYKEELDLTGGEITVEKEDDTEEVISLTDQDVEVLDFDNSEIGKITLTVLYKGYETTFDVEITEEAPDENIKNIKITQKPNKTVYVFDKDGFDPTGFEITVEYKDGTKEVIKLEDHPDDYTVVGFDNTKLGEQEITIIYKGHKINLNIKVVASAQDVPEDGEYVPIPNTLKGKSIVVIIIGIIMIGTGIWTIYKYNKKRLDS